MKATGLFAGIGGIEFGLHQSGIDAYLLSEIMPEAQSVLKNRYPKAKFSSDVTTLQKIGGVDILAGGFPCQDLSIAGNKVGIEGERSGLVREFFRLIEGAKTKKPKFILIENVANIISLNKGEALKLITEEIHKLGYNWAYRLVDPRSLGIPQRRPRFIFVASNVIHPKNILFPDYEDVTASIDDKPKDDIVDAHAYGFYWTEGKIGIGWAKDSIPPLKCGSTLGLPSSPAIWDIDNNFFGTPTIEDAERLQGFPEDWTKPIEIEGFKPNLRWKLVGNAVNTRVSEWVGYRIKNNPNYVIDPSRVKKSKCKPWPKAGFNEGNDVMEIAASFYPEGINYVPILEYLNHPLKPLSLKATLGFYNRVCASTLIKYPEQFKQSIKIYLKNQYNYDYEGQ